MKSRSRMLKLLMVFLTSTLVFIGCGEREKKPIINNAPVDTDTICTPQQVGYGQDYVCINTEDIVSNPFENTPKVYTATVRPNLDGFKDFLKEALGVCDRQSGQLAGIDFGSHDCNAYLGGQTAFTIYAASPNASRANVTVSSYFQQTGGINFNLSFGLTLAPWAYQNPMGLPNLSVAPVNDDNGFEIYGPATNPAFQAYSLAWAKKLRIRVNNGKMTDSIIRADIFYGNQKIAENVPFQLQNIGY